MKFNFMTNLFCFLFIIKGSVLANVKQVPFDKIDRDIFCGDSDCGKRIAGSDLDNDYFDKFVFLGRVVLSNKKLAIVKDRIAHKLYEIYLGQNFYGYRVDEIYKNKLVLRNDNNILIIGKVKK
ncbi:hypothetical protein [Piscirickettsia litoralis]|uniref:Uncharacterized protein n=1 Tax=Piscirickettsia litoralis TaxID=1891921 RepID=A0ABX3A6Q3_9GAMM|nr:hypothetical protein [Piscirickettsia litoralis]ODN43120.1 hypothetical protein BGC07_09615 [Piscirickettsia litoralis]